MPSCHPLQMGSSWYARGCWYHSGPGTLPNAKFHGALEQVQNSTLPCFSATQQALHVSLKSFSPKMLKIKIRVQIMYAHM